VKDFKDRESRIMNAQYCTAQNHHNQYSESASKSYEIWPDKDLGGVFSTERAADS
jgi:hypothetical protein